ncbi:MAG: biotin-dependent carboxyltransferase family protein [Alphaproteobacteria bacterium]|nr:biotin-dependent carboxyltransferase family protein [Alphaproteobacteria bacterium]
MVKLFVNNITAINSVQDAGRPRFQRYGLPAGGAMDPLAIASANCLVGNPLFAAALEIGPGEASFILAEGRIRIALSGARRPIAIDGRPIPLDCSTTLDSGEILTLGSPGAGVFSYLAFEGGIEGTESFGSMAVHAAAGLGSPYPRPLRSGDELNLAQASDTPERSLAFSTDTEEPIRIVPGPQFDEFDEDSQVLLVNSDWSVSPSSDRMGYRLQGPALKHIGGHNIVSDGTVDGSIQVPGNGMPIVLMRDRGTTGGYPKIATVISADLRRLAQMPAGQLFRFLTVSVPVAQHEARRMARLLRTLPTRLEVATPAHFDIEALLSGNTAGNAVSASDPQTWGADTGRKTWAA